MSKYVWKSEYFCGNKVSDYGLQNGYIDYGTLAKAFDAVLVNNITKLFLVDINGEYNEPEQVNGFIDNSEEIEELQEKIETLEDLITDDSTNEQDEQTIERIKELELQIKELEFQIEELEEEQDELPEVYQWFIISATGADILYAYTNELVYYLPVLDCYVWGVTHWGTSWDYVLTDIKIELEER